MICACHESFVVVLICFVEDIYADLVSCGFETLVGFARMNLVIY